MPPGLPTPAELAMLARLTRDLPRFLREPVSPAEAVEIVTRRLERRAERFLAFVEHAVYRHPTSPYRRLLRSAGCEPGDLRALVRGDGLDGALRQLAARGVYVTFAEFKGRHEIVRGSERFAVEESAFDRPGLVPHFVRRTGGTRGPGTEVRIALPFIAAQAPNHALGLAAHGLDGAEHVVWQTAPLRDLLMYARADQRLAAWFYPLRPLPRKIRLVGLHARLLGRLAGRALPPPIWLDLRQPARLAAWLADRAANGRATCVTTYTSSAVRVAVAARDLGLSLRGVGFVGFGEPFTEARQRELAAVGARALPRYGFIEAGSVAYPCAAPRAVDDTHLFSDCLALIQRPTPVADLGLSVDAFLFTSLLPDAPKVLLNVESGDHGTVEVRDCGCPLGSIGLRTHLSSIRSHEKLTGEGMTFIRTYLERVLEEVLPARFGGSPTDYQVLEEEDARGIHRLYLLVEPALGALDEAALRRTFLAELGRGGELERHMASFWERAETIQVRRRAPVATGIGKVFPFHRREPARMRGSPAHES